MASKKAAKEKSGLPAKQKDVSLPVGADLTSMNLLRQASQQGQGFDVEDVALPWLKVLQDMNDEVKKKHPKQVAGAEPGFFFNTVTQQLWDGDEGIILLPVAYRRSFTEWVTRKNGGGFVADHGSDPSIMRQTTRNEDNQDILPNGHQIVRSMMYYVFVVDEETGDVQPAIFSLKGTQLKKGRNWNARMTQLMIPDGNGNKFNPPKYYMSYKVTTLLEQNDQGTWYGVEIAPYKSVFEFPDGATLLRKAMEFEAMVKQGDVKVKYDEDLAEAEVSETDDEAF